MNKQDTILLANKVLNEIMDTSDNKYPAVLEDNELDFIGSGILTRAYRHDESDFVILISRDPIKRVMSDMTFETMVNLNFIGTFRGVRADFDLYVAPYISGVVSSILGGDYYDDKLWDSSLDYDSKLALAEMRHTSNTDDILYPHNLDKFDKWGMVPDKMVNELKALAKTCFDRGITPVLDIHFGNICYQNGKLILLDPFV